MSASHTTPHHTTPHHTHACPLHIPFCHFEPLHTIHLRVRAVTRAVIQLVTRVCPHFHPISVLATQSVLFYVCVPCPRRNAPPTHPPPPTHTPPPALSNSNTTHFTSPHHRTTQTPPHPVCDATRATTAQTTRRTCASCMRVTAAMHANQTSPCRTHHLSQPARPPSIQSISPVPIPVLAQISKLPRYTSMAPHDKPSIHQWTS